MFLRVGAGVRNIFGDGVGQIHPSLRLLQLPLSNCGRKQDQGYKEDDSDIDIRIGISRRHSSTHHPVHQQHPD